jgi:hypothetical protein
MNVGLGVGALGSRHIESQPSHLAGEGNLGPVEPTSHQAQASTIHKSVPSNTSVPFLQRALTFPQWGY